jgi:hypothetical protein
MLGFSTAILFSLFLMPAPVAQSRPRVEAVVAAVSRNVKELQDILPDFVCNERITSTIFESGRVQKTKVVDSLFSVRNHREQREVIAIDGKPAKKGSKMPSLPANINGTFNYVPIATFSPANLEAHKYDLRKPADAEKFVVQFATTSDQKKLFWNLNGDTRVAMDTGIAWIDMTSMQVVRIERNLMNLPSSLSRWAITVDQAPITIGEKQFWLPQTFQTEVSERDPRKTALFVSEYSNCKKFGADIRILQ